MTRSHYIAFDEHGDPWGVLEFDPPLPPTGLLLAIDEAGVAWGELDVATGVVTPFEHESER